MTPLNQKFSDNPSPYITEVNRIETYINKTLSTIVFYRRK